MECCGRAWFGIGHNGDERLAILDRTSELDLRWNPVAHSRIALCEEESRDWGR